MEENVHFQNLIKPFLEDKLSPIEKRKFIFHIDSCPTCKDLLLEEYMFHVIFNDQDKDMNLSYTENLNNLLLKIKNEILNSDKNITMQYSMLSIIIILCMAVIFSFFTRVFL